jgi:hypothetical protein
MSPKLLERKLDLLSGAAAQQLFWKCAGREGATDAGPAWRLGLEAGVVSACGGLPLALELAGRFLRDKSNADGWQVRRQGQRLVSCWQRAGRGRVGAVTA